MRPRYSATLPNGFVWILNPPVVGAVSPEGKEFKVERHEQVGDLRRVYLSTADQTAVLMVSLDWEADGWTFQHGDPLDLVSKHPIRADMMVRIAAIPDPVERERALVKAPDMLCSDDAVTIAPLADSDIPQDRTFRDGWTCNGSKIEHDMPKCREIHKAKMREVRAPKLAALDVDFMRAVEAGNVPEQARVTAAKQALRDVTDRPEVASARTPEELKAVWPDILNGRPPGRPSRKSDAP